MKKMALLLLLFPLNAPADTPPGNADELVRWVQNRVKTEQVIVGKRTGGGPASIGVLIPSKEIFSSPTELTEGGGKVLEQFGRFAGRTKKKVTILVPDEREHQDFRRVVFSMRGSEIRRNAFIGPHVYIVVSNR